MACLSPVQRVRINERGKVLLILVAPTQHLRSSLGLAKCTAFFLLLAYGTAPSLADGLSEASGKSGNSASPPDESSGLDEIVVTAQKRSERLQDVPMSISAFNGNALSKLNVTDWTSQRFVDT